MKLSLEPFDLEFIGADPYEGIYDEESGEYTLTNEEVLRQMRDSIPPEAIYLGYLYDEILGFCITWVQRIYIYIVPWNESDDYDWALFRISWDDNWGKWEWSTEARISGIDCHKEAGKLMTKALFESWGYDLNDEEKKVYKNFLNDI